jgi:hypothetical protein
LLFVISFSVFSVVACFCLPVARIQKSLRFFVLWCFSGKYIRAFVARRFKNSKIQKFNLLVLVPGFKNLCVFSCFGVLVAQEIRAFVAKKI